MNKIEKLLRKISASDRERLLAVIERLITGNTEGFDIKKLHNSDFYRVRSGRFRIIFHHDEISKEVIIDSIKLRNEKTYSYD